MIFSWWISDVCIHKMSQIKYKEQKNDSYLPSPCQNVIGKSDKVNIKLKRVSWYENGKSKFLLPGTENFYTLYQTSIGESLLNSLL